MQPELQPDISALVQGRAERNKHRTPCSPYADQPSNTVIDLEFFKPSNDSGLYFRISESQILYLDGCRATWRILPPGDPAWTG